MAVINILAEMSAAAAPDGELVQMYAVSIATDGDSMADRADVQHSQCAFGAVGMSQTGWRDARQG
jgi:hypothetical protein